MRLRLCIAGGALVLLFPLAAGCAARPSPERVAEEAAARNQALIAAGNQAYRSHDYELAAKRYAAAAVAKKDDAAAFFGMGMALSKLGRINEARAAYARSRELSRQRPRRRRRPRRTTRDRLLT